MTYSPINTQAYVSAYSGAIAGMGVSGWIVDPTSGDYSRVSAIAGAFAEAFDIVWNNATVLNSLEVQSIQTICQNEFGGRGPGSLDTASLALASNWMVPAAACAALVLEGDAYFQSQGITPPTPGSGAFDPIFQQLWLDTSKPDGGNGSIGTPYNTWANTVAPLQSSGALGPWLIQIAQNVDASGVPIPNIGAGGHDTGQVKIQGVLGSSFFASDSPTLNGLEIDFQDGGRIQLDLVNILVGGLTLHAGANSLLLTGNNARIIGVSSDGGTVTGGTYLINCSVDGFILPELDLRMEGGTIEQDVSIQNGFLTNVEFEGATTFRWAGTLTLRNCAFQPGVQLLADSASRILDLDLDTWGAMEAANVSFTDTRPSLIITPWMPIIASKAVERTDNINPNTIQTFDEGTLVRPAQRSTPCIVSFGDDMGPNFVVVGAFIDTNSHLQVMVLNLAATTQEYSNPTYTITYLPLINIP